MRRRSTAHGIWPPRRSCATQIGAARPGFLGTLGADGEGPSLLPRREGNRAVA
nr:MAG TPA: hypothetical protein [Caudoviricetes sp.]